MTPPRTCTHCQSDKVMFPVRFNAGMPLEYGQAGILLTSPKEEGAWLQLPDVTGYPAVASVCGNCGHIEQYITHPGEAWAKWQKGYR